MRPLVRLTLAALTIGTAVACTGNSAPVEHGGNQPSPDGAPAALYDTVRIALGHEAVFDRGRFAVRFVERVKDDRCPANAMCVRWGSAHAKVRLRAGTAARDALLGAGEPDPAAPASVRVALYEVKLLELAPYPGTYDPAVPPAPSILVRVTK